MTLKEEQNSKATSGYNIKISGKQLHVTDAMKQYALEKMSRIERFSPRTIDVQITMDIQRFQHHVSIVLKFDHIKVQAEASTDNMYTSIDVAMNRIESQLNKYRKRLHEYQSRAALSTSEMQVDVVRNPNAEFLDDINDAIEEENQRQIESAFQPHEIVSQETLPLKVHSPEEAIMKMELSRDHFMVFKNEKDQIKIIYRRNDGNYGIISPL